MGCAGGATGDAGARASADMGAALGRAGRRRRRAGSDGEGEEKTGRRSRRGRMVRAGLAVGIAGIALLCSQPAAGLGTTREVGTKPPFSLLMAG